MTVGEVSLRHGVLIPAAEPGQLASAADFHLLPHLHLQGPDFSWELKGVYSRKATGLPGVLARSLPCSHASALLGSSQLRFSGPRPATLLLVLASGEGLQPVPF